MSKKSPISFEEFEKLKSALQAGAPLSFVIYSDSMEPILKAGDRVSVVPISRPLKIFDLIVFFQENDLVCHLFIKKSLLNHSLITTSFKYRKFDYPVKEDHLLGVVDSHRLSFLQKLKLLIYH